MDIMRGFERLTPLAGARDALLAAVRPVPPLRRPLRVAIGHVLAEAIHASTAHPDRRTATRDGWAVMSGETIGATPYAPITLAEAPRPVRAGQAMPAGCDAVLPPHALDARDDGFEILHAPAPGADTREAGRDLAAGTMILAAGRRLRSDQAALLALAGLKDVSVRVPRLHITAPDDGPWREMMATLAVAAGAEAIDEEADADATVAFGQPGHAGTAPLAAGLAARGTLIAHGLAARPGEAIAVGLVRVAERARPAFVVPAGLDDALAAWLLLVAPTLAALAGSREAPGRETSPLTRKIVSAPGMADLVLLRRSTRLAMPHWEPLAAGDLPWSAIAGAEAYALVPGESEGLPAGAMLAGWLL